MIEVFENNGLTLFINAIDKDKRAHDVYAPFVLHRGFERFETEGVDENLDCFLFDRFVNDRILLGQLLQLLVERVSDFECVHR